MNSKNASSEWPMLGYMDAWRVFRKASNENLVTAQHIVDRDNWPSKGKSISIVDIGCGDGGIISEIATRSPADIAAIRLIEPNREFLAQAAKNCEGNARKVEPICSTFIQCANTCFMDVDAVIAAHLVYLLPDGELECMLARLPKHVPMYIVFDDQNSIFSKLWAITAPKYLGRAKHARDVIANLSTPNWRVATSTLTSEIGDPATYNAITSTHLYSLLCYTDIQSCPTEELDNIKSIVKRHVSAGKVRCQSVCYELVKINE